MRNDEKGWEMRKNERMEKGRQRKENRGKRRERKNQVEVGEN